MNTEQEAYRISSIKVEGLFGMFDHEIPLNMDERITIVYGENGIGKTMVFRIVHAFLKRQFWDLKEIPFKKLRLVFSNGISIYVENHGRLLASINREISDSILIDLEGHQNLLLDYLMTNVRIDHGGLLKQLRNFVKYVGAMQPIQGDFFELKQLLSDAVESFIQVANFATLGSVLNALTPFEYTFRTFFKLEFSENYIDQLQKILVRIQGFFIETNRLFITENGKMPNEVFFTKYTNSVDHLSADLATRIQAARDKYAAETERLEKSFVKRLSSGKIKLNYEIGELKVLAQEIRVAYQELVDLGLMSEEEPPVDLDISDDLPHEAFATMGVGLHDMKEKLSLYHELEIQVRLLLTIINERRFSFKKLEVNPQKGFVFMDSQGHELSATHLSSGEQHELVLLYNLIFNTPPGSLVMLDEPELSLHVAWQMEFLKDMREIIALRKFDLLVATHSPSIINGEWDLTVPLKGQIAHA